MRLSCDTCRNRSYSTPLSEIQRDYSTILVTSTRTSDILAYASEKPRHVNEKLTQILASFHFGWIKRSRKEGYDTACDKNKMEFPNLGEHCSESTCNRLDFLPLKCDACKEIFCTDHISYTNHSCPSEYKKNVQVPVCPLCNVPIPTKRGDPPDLAVGLHIDNDCQADFGKNRRKIFSNKCSSKGCKVKEMVQVKCSECGANFCLKHRHPTDHACIGAEEALRLHRLEALNKKAQTTISQNSGNSNSLRRFQGTMSEDEALARALQASLQDEERNRRELQLVPSGNRDRCRLS